MENLNEDQNNFGQQMNHLQSSRSDQQSVRNEMEAQMNDRIQIMRNLYEMKYLTLQESIKEAYFKIFQDELIDTMKKDPISQEFLHQRVKELFEETISNEREVIIEKLSNQYAYLKSEYNKLEYEKRMVANNLDEFNQEGAKQVSALKEQLGQESQKRQFFENEYNILQQKVRQLSEQFDDALQKKESEMQQKIEKDHLSTLQNMQRFGQLENDLKEKEILNQQLNGEISRLKALVDQDKDVMKNQEFDIKQLKMEQENILQQLKKEQFDNDERLNDIKILSQEINDLQNELVAQKYQLDEARSQKKQQEQSFNDQLQDLQTKLRLEQNDKKEQIEKLKAKSKGKIEVFKKKLLDYKQRNQDKEAQLQQQKQLVEDVKVAGQKQVTLLQKQLDDIKTQYEDRIQELQQSTQEKIEGLQEKQEQDVLELQEHYKNILDQKIQDVQNDTQQQITKMKAQEKELRQAFNEKLEQVEREYIKRQEHTIEVEQHRLENEKLSLENRRLQEQHAQEVKQMNAQFDEGKRNELQELSENYEKQVAQLKEEVQFLELKVQNMNQQMKAANSIAQITSNNNKLFEKIHSMSSIAAEGNSVVNNNNNQAVVSSVINKPETTLVATAIAQSLGAQLKDVKMKTDQDEKQSKVLVTQLRQQNEDLSKIVTELENVNNNLAIELKEAQEDLSGKEQELQERQIRIQGLDKQLFELQGQVKALSEVLTGTKMELSELKINSTQSLHFKEEMITNLKENVAEVKAQNKEANEKLYAAMQEKSQKQEEFANKQEQFQQELLVLRNSVGQKEREATQLASDLNTTKAESSRLEQRLLENEQTFKEMEQQLDNQYQIQARVEQQNASLRQIMQNLVNRLRLDMNSLKNEAQNIRSFAAQQVQQRENENNYMKGQLINRLKEIMQEREHGCMVGMQDQRAQMEREMNEHIEELKKKFNAAQKEQFENYSKENSQIKEYGKRLSKANEELIEELKKQQAESTVLQQRLKEMVESHTSLSRKVGDQQQEIAGLVNSKESLEQQLIEDVNNIKKDYKNKYERLRLVRSEKITALTAEARQLAEQVENLKQQHTRSQTEADLQLSNLHNQHELELNDVQKNHDRAFESLQKQLKQATFAEVGIKEEFQGVSEHCKHLEEMLREREMELKHLRAESDQKLREFEQLMSQISINAKLKEEQVQLVVQEKQSELVKSSEYVEQLQQELQERNNQVNELINVKMNQTQAIKDLKLQLEFKDQQLNSQQELQLKQNSDLEEMHKLLSKSFKTIKGNQDSIQLSKKLDEETKELNKKVKDLQNINKYLESSKGSLRKSQINSVNNSVMYQHTGSALAEESDKPTTYKKSVGNITQFNNISNHNNSNNQFNQLQ